MIKHPVNLFKKLSDDEIKKLIDSALEILKTAGYDVFSPSALSVLKEAGVKTDGERVFPEPEFIMEHVRKAPRQWTWQARNPDKDVIIGDGSLALSPTYGGCFIVDSKGIRRDTLLADYVTLTKISHAIGEIDACSFTIVEPQDVPVEERALKMTKTLLELTDKPIMGAVTSPEGARQSIEMARLAMGDRKDGTFILGLINGNSPLCLEINMGESMMEYVDQGQPVLWTPCVNMGITGPVTPEGTCALYLAEILMGLAIIQLKSPGHPVIMGVGVFGTDLRNASTGFGRAEQVLGTMIMAQISHRLGIPFRSSSSVTGSLLTDMRAGYESMQTAMSAWLSGGSLALQSFGVMDNISSVSFEKFMFDLEIWRNIRSFARTMNFSEENLAIDVAKEHPAMYLAHPHTMKHFRETIYSPMFAPPKPYDPNNIANVTEMAGELFKKELAGYEQPLLDNETIEAMNTLMQQQ